MKMKVGKKKLWICGTFICVLFIICYIAISESGSAGEGLIEKFKKAYKPIEPLLPPDVKVKPGFEGGRVW